MAPRLPLFESKPYRRTRYIVSRRTLFASRGRDADHSTPPAQIRTGGTTAYGSYLRECGKRTNRTPYNLWNTQTPALCRETCQIERCSPWSTPFPHQPPRKTSPRCSAGSSVIWRSPTSPERACPPFGLSPSRTGLDLSTKTFRRSPGSRACCFSACLGSLTTQDRTIHSRLTWLSYRLPQRRESRHPERSSFRSSIAQPTDASVYASSRTSR